ncbi:putative exonuclease VIII, ds DNA exonuclease encoded by prophage [Escherichia coli 2730450]|nr:putative exonuclease VIII, ds DNA exonuclease encoded by prophage [Escherichia coli 2730450]
MARNSAEMRIWKKRREGERKETGKYTSVVDLARARANQQTLKIQQEKSTRSLLPFIANTSRHGKHWMRTGLRSWPGDDAGNIAAASIAGQKMKLSQRPRRLEAYLGINAQTA